MNPIEAIIKIHALMARFPHHDYDLVWANAQVRELKKVIDQVEFLPELK